MISHEELERFEAGLDPCNLSQAPLPVHVLGYGEISTVFQIGSEQDYAYKRMPLFDSVASAESYGKNYREYCQYLVKAGLTIPEDDLDIVALPNRPVVLYIRQKRLPPEQFAHKLIQRLSGDELIDLIERIGQEIDKIGIFNQKHHPDLEIALDGQLSNWVVGGSQVIQYIDTSTPLMRKGGVEQLDPELFLQSAPSFLRWIIRSLFLEDVMNRYYDLRQVYVDLVANLFKEQRPDLVPEILPVVNRHLTEDLEPITLEEVQKYYKEDKIIWALFLTFRRWDRALKTKLFRQRYEFILPGKIKR
jgi:hypothetical protein